MYRLLLLILSAAAAPQDNSIQYVKQLPPADLAPQTYAPAENLPTSSQDSEYGDNSSIQEDQTTTQLAEDASVEESAETTEATTFAVTEKYEAKTTPTPKFNKAPPRFYSKLSYFEKPSYSVSTNQLERAGKRQFRSRCRCERISNCPKLQITVPRCPEEYFLCCF